jgi:hypothetical protein
VKERAVTRSNVKTFFLGENLVERFLLFYAKIFFDAGRKRRHLFKSKINGFKSNVTLI